MMERDDIHIISKSKPSKRSEDVEENNIYHVEDYENISNQVGIATKF